MKKCVYYLLSVTKEGATQNSSIRHMSRPFLSCREIISNTLSRFKKSTLAKTVYTGHVHRTKKFRYPISILVLKLEKELVKTALITVSGKVII